jgi:DNA polymerase-3 subunit gamma/tau
MARKYRPRTFSDLVGQEQVTRTLTQALKTGRVAHAYLFTGPRGVGKTTAARLLAAALSCESEGDRPCGECARCLEIQSGRSVDVIEMDAASNRGIDEIRGLRETVKFQPARNRFKVYIIDEVHALTGDAFNALLKTLEEPPSHVVFVFATTDAHKVPATIVSRCQRYDFRRIKVEDIVSRLRAVAEAENLPYEPEALAAMARQAEGGLRDALGLCDQVAASDGRLTVEAVTRSLGIVQRALVSRVALSPLRGDAADALLALRDAYETGSDFRELGLRILEYVRDLALIKASPKAFEMMDLSDAEERDFREAAKSLTLQDVHRHFESWLRLYSELARHPQPRWLMESHIIRLSQAGRLDGLAELTARLTALLESDPAALRDALRGSRASQLPPSRPAPPRPLAQGDRAPAGVPGPGSPAVPVAATSPHRFPDPDEEDPDYLYVQPDGPLPLETKAVRPGAASAKAPPDPQKAPTGTTEILAGAADDVIAPPGAPSAGQIAGRPSGPAGPAAPGSVPLASPHPFYGRPEGKEVVDRIKTTPEVKELMRRLPGSFVGYAHAEVGPVFPPGTWEDAGDEFRDEEEDSFADDYAPDGPPDTAGDLDGEFADDESDGYRDD